MNKDFESTLNTIFSKDEIEIFKSKIKDEAISSIFINELKSEKAEILSKIDFPLTKTDLHNSMYYFKKENIGKTWQYQCGLIYPQEISAGIAPTILNPSPKSVVLDMCSAPGGKALQLANITKDEACLILNEYSFKRSLIELSNIEKTGFSNYILFNKNPEQIAKEFESCVDFCLVDAPCSGEGMIRKKPEILDNYNLNEIEICVKRQKEILDSAYKVLKQGAFLVYSTCTYNLDENEKLVSYFLDKYSDIKLIEIKHPHKRRGISLNNLNGNYMLRFNILDNTEGQFVALFQKTTGVIKEIKCLESIRNKPADDFIKDNLLLKDYYLYQKNDQVYLKLHPFVNTKIEPIRQGILLGTIKNNRLVPEHHLYRCNWLKDKFKYQYNLNDEEYDYFIKGLEIPVNLENQYYSITYNNYLLGFGKVVNGILKNKYPKGLRI